MSCQAGGNSWLKIHLHMIHRSPEMKRADHLNSLYKTHFFKRFEAGDSPQNYPCRGISA